MGVGLRRGAGGWVGGEAEASVSVEVEVGEDAAGGGVEGFGEGGVASLGAESLWICWCIIRSRLI